MWLILIIIVIVIFLYLWFKGKNLDSNDTWTSKLNEKNEKSMIRDEFNAARDSNNALFWWLTWYTIANLFNKNEDKEENNDIEEKDEENTWNDEQWIENENSDFEQDFDDFDSSFDSSFDDWWDDWWFDD